MMRVFKRYIAFLFYLVKGVLMNHSAQNALLFQKVPSCHPATLIPILIVRRAGLHLAGQDCVECGSVECYYLYCNGASALGW